ncbi:MAG TPA: EpsD family peptidyl-prolyl cis-trans isomerase [Burkholderiaceae bacterium]|nr:EpsD family peptidyl-prolyl cis-trans isomerase [Burkholderiaceae bacterium]
MRLSLEGIHPAALGVALVMSVALVACGAGGGSNATQVAVKVNNDEITVLQLNEQLAHLGAGLADEQVEQAKRKILAKMVNQQLLVQQAIEHKLDRDAEVVGALEAARLNILARAYVQRIIAPQATPAAHDVEQYYAENPTLFAERKVYRLQELTIEANGEQEKAIESVAAGAKSLKQLADYLREKKIPFSADSGVRTAEQLPLARLPKIAQLKTGNVLVFPGNGGRLNAVEVLASQAQPVEEKKAAPAIEQYLTNRKRDELASNELKRLHEAAKIEYVGDFAKYAGDAPLVTSALPNEKSTDGEKEKGIASLR